eukprot:scaffold69606_cov25-Prasinocladus_malaysianus.AAC.1
MGGGDVGGLGMGLSRNWHVTEISWKVTALIPSVKADIKGCHRCWGLEVRVSGVACVKGS